MHGGVVQIDHAAGALFGRVDHAGVEWARVDVEAHRSLPEPLGIHNTMDRISGIDGTGMRRAHFNAVCRSELTLSGIHIL